MDASQDRRGSAASTGTSAARAWLVLTTLLTTPLFVLGGWWLVARAPNAAAAAGIVEAVLVPVVLEDVRSETSVSVELVEAPGLDVIAEVSGIVTEGPTEGALLGNGDLVLRVDDRPLRAMVSVAPLWRPLQLGDEGPDVRRLQDYLAALGYEPGSSDGTFGPAVRTAVEAFNRDRGLDGPVFVQESVVWVGPEPLLVADGAVAEGTAVFPGAVVLTGPSQLESLRVSEPPGGLAALGDFGQEVTLVIGSAEAPYSVGSGSISDDGALRVIQGALAPATDGVARVVAKESHRVAVVPASALVQGLDGSLCVYGGSSLDPVAVTPIGGGVSSAYLAPDLPVAEVLANPERVSLDVPCGL